MSDSTQPTDEVFGFRVYALTFTLPPPPLPSHPPPPPLQSELQLVQDEALAEQAKAQQQRVAQFWEAHWQVGRTHWVPSSAPSS